MLSAVREDGAARQSGTAARLALREPARTSAGSDGAAVRGHDGGWAAGFARRPARQSCAPRLLGDMVRGMRYGSAAYARDRKEVSRRTTRGAQHQPGHESRTVEGLHRKT